jgi:1,2-diacylglycerol 3-alpha-glucosyltransferase
MDHQNILLVWDRMGDYHRARWLALQQVMPQSKVYAADLGSSDALYGWHTTAQHDLYIQLSDKPAPTFDWKRIIRFGHCLRRYNIGTVCIAGYGRPEYVVFLLYSKLLGKKIILFAESWYGTKGLFNRLKGTFLRACCDGFLVSGKRAYNHFVTQLKQAADMVRVGYSVVNNDHFTTSENRLYGHKIILCVARFVPEKNLELLIKCFQSSVLNNTGWKLHIIGGGPLHSALSSLIQNDAVLLETWLPYDIIPKKYAEASVFILPSKFEPWGLAVNEAMAAGLPVILSTDVGCEPDLLQEGTNGWKFDSESHEQLQHIFQTISELTADDLAKMGVASSEIIKRYNLSTFANNLKTLILQA